ncbi:MAG TPA: hypothetical protein VFB69_03010 [Candidatus Dormibacteraeota bacterium]|nr:hypothetical protein [Candidatus Dormibacteraeota bacterium]
MDAAVVISLGRFFTVLGGAAALGLMGVLLGVWWAPFVAGVVAGLFIVRGRRALVAGALVGLAGWGVPLAYAQLQYGLGKTAFSLAAIMGFNGASTIPVALTLIVAVMLGFSGAWLGASARSFLPFLQRGSKAPATATAPAPSKAGAAVTSKARS